MAGAVRIGHDDVQVGLEERQVVVAAVPQNHVGLGLGLPEDRFVIDPRVDHDASIEMRLVFLALLNGAAVRVQIGIRGETLHALLDQIAVGHRVAHGHDLLAHPLEQARDVARGLRLAAAGAHRANSDDRLARPEHGRLGADQPKVGACGQHDAAPFPSRIGG